MKQTLLVLMFWSILMATATDSLSVKVCLEQTGYRAASGTRTQSGAWIVTATIDSHGVSVLLDPNVPFTFLDGAAMRKLGYSPKPTRKEISFGGAREPVYTIATSSFALGGMRTADTQQFEVTRINAVVGAAGVGEVEIAGVFGLEFLKRCDALIDLEGGQVFLRQPRPLPPDSAAADTTKKQEPLFGDLERKLKERDKRKEGVQQ